MLRHTGEHFHEGTNVWVANSKLGQNPSFSSVLRSVVKGAFVVFGNSTISLHILRGVLAAAAIYGLLATMSRTIWPSIILLPTAVYLNEGLTDVLDHGS